MKLQRLIEQHWYKVNNLYLAWFLLPLSWIFLLISKIRFYFYRWHILKSYKLSVPVVIVGNISVGGVGKTPLTKYLAEELITQNIQVGVILRGYKGKIKHAFVVKSSATCEMVGDEALIYAQNGIPVAIGPNRYQAGLALLKHYPHIQLILADDGLQHYSLKRDYEIAVIDAARMLGNRFILPMGPLRETVTRLNSVDAIVINGRTTTAQLSTLPPHKMLVNQNLVLDKIYNPVTKVVATSTEFQDKKVSTIAAIGNPQRFFDNIQQIGINLYQTLAYPDHHQYKVTDIPENCDVILVTEKDYVKLAHLNNDKIWVVLVKSELNNPQLLSQIRQLIRN